MPDPTICPHCGAYSPIHCTWDEMTGDTTSPAPCEMEEWQINPDFMRDDRAERERLEWEDGE